MIFTTISGLLAFSSLSVEMGISQSTVTSFVLVTYWLVLVPVVTNLDIVMLQYLVMYIRCYSVVSVDVFFDCKGVAASSYMFNSFFKLATKATHWIGSIFDDPKPIRSRR